MFYYAKLLVISHFTLLLMTLYVLLRYIDHTDDTESNLLWFS